MLLETACRRSRTTTGNNFQINLDFYRIYSNKGQKVLPGNPPPQDGTISHFAVATYFYGIVYFVLALQLVAVKCSALVLKSLRRLIVVYSTVLPLRGELACPYIFSTPLSDLGAEQA
jgi:hypothetical protein